MLIPTSCHGHTRRDPARPCRSARRNRATLAVGLAAAGFLATVAFARPAEQNANGTRSVRAGVYTNEQADRGEQVFNSVCANCHLVDEFVGPPFMNGWTNQPAHSLFDLIRRTMPEDNPGSLSRDEYADVLTYLFKMNGMPAGTTELDDSDEALKKVIIEGPYEAAKGP